MTGDTGGTLARPARSLYPEGLSTIGLPGRWFWGVMALLAASIGVGAALGAIVAGRPGQGALLGAVATGVLYI